VKDELDATKDVLMQNIEKLLERERFLVDLEESTDQFAVRETDRHQVCDFFFFDVDGCGEISPKVKAIGV
jgi:hypothetical protein